MNQQWRQAQIPNTFHPVTMASGIRANVARHPNKLAIICGSRSLSYSRLIERIDRVSALATHGLRLRPGDRAALISSNCLEFIEIVDGLSEAGIAVATPNPRQTVGELAYILNDCGARVAFVSPEAEEMVRAADCPALDQVIVLGPQYEALLQRTDPLVARIAVDEWDPFAITYTSGTTGVPRGVVLPHRSRTHAAFCMAAEYGCYGPDDRFLAVTPMFHGAGYNFAHASIFFGGTCEIIPKFEPELTLKALNESGASGVFLVPTIFQAMLGLETSVLDRYRGTTLKAMMSNAAPLAQKTKESVIEYFGSGVLHELYGSTEGGIVCNLRPADQLVKERCVGHPFMMNHVKLLDDLGSPVPQGEVGELFNISPCLFLGYWNNPAATAAAMRDGWFSAGDLAWQDEDGCYYIVDRKKDMYISGGVNVYPREIEELVSRMPNVIEASIVGVEDAYWGETGKAFLVMAPGTSTTLAELQDFCRASLASYKTPSQLVFVDALPRNASGKVLKTALRAL